MTHWQWAILLKPAFLVAYVVLIAAALWAAHRLPAPIRRIALLRLPETRATGFLMLALAAIIVAIAITAP